MKEVSCKIVSRRIAKIFTVSRKSHHSVETLTLVLPVQVDFAFCCFSCEREKERSQHTGWWNISIQDSQSLQKDRVQRDIFSIVPTMAEDWNLPVLRARRRYEGHSNVRLKTQWQKFQFRLLLVTVIIGKKGKKVRTLLQVFKASGKVFVCLHVWSVLPQLSSQKLLVTIRLRDFFLSVFHGVYPVHSSGLSMWLGGAWDQLYNWNTPSRGAGLRQKNLRDTATDGFWEYRILSNATNSSKHDRRGFPLALTKGITRQPRVV